ncbi:LysR family transcriptional regulator [Thalassospira lucentensis]|uniref:LysR family transcriptional regulator n=1 Tax=Thalassospira lucentensis TaxID=168935 RepID=UPI003AA96D61
MYHKAEVSALNIREVITLIKSITDIDLRLLRVFDTVTKCGGFAAAQAVLNVSQANISMQMKHLEERLGVVLCHRGRSGFWLTEEGKAVLDACHVLFRSLDEFRAVVSAAAGAISGRLHLSIVDNSIFNEKFHLASAIRSFKERSPNSEIVVNVTATNDVEQMVLDGSCDLGIGFFPARRQGLTYNPLYTAGMHLYCGARSPLFERAPYDLAIEDILAEEHAARAYISNTQLPSFEKKFSVGASAANIEGLMMLIISGKYTAYLPSHYANHWVKTDQIRPLLPDQLGYQCLYEVATKPKRNRSELLEMFIDTLLQEHDPVELIDYRIGSPDPN